MVVTTEEINELYSVKNEETIIPNTINAVEIIKI